jgi:spermidine synthase
MTAHVPSLPTPGTLASAEASHYGRVAALYELVSALGSGGQIQNSKLYHLTLLDGPKHILYPGAGRGGEVVRAVRAGHRVTVVELDTTMLALAKRLFAAEGVLNRIECIEGSVLDHARPGAYDVVVASYLLDVFSPDVMRDVYRHLVGLLREDGLLFLSGYAPLHGSRLHQGLQWLNHAYANWFCHLLVDNARHPIYDYAALYADMGLCEVHRRDFPHFGSFGPRFHRLWAAAKVRKA